jgi:hypothetical protein
VQGLELRPGTVTVLWHSVMWQYVPQEQQERVLAGLSELGSAASDDTALVHLFAEPTRRTPGDEHRFWVCAESWPGLPGHAAGERVFLGRMAPHGVPTSWDVIRIGRSGDHFV